MAIEKNGKVYSVRENMKSWTVSTILYGVSVRYIVPKSNAQPFDEFKSFVAKTDLF